LKSFPDAESAAAQLKSLVRPGDAVLLKASRAERMERVQEMYAAP